jgi:hypothetical protein
LKKPLQSWKKHYQKLRTPPQLNFFVVALNAIAFERYCFDHQLARSREIVIVFVQRR